MSYLYDRYESNTFEPQLNPHHKNCGGIFRRGAWSKDLEKRCDGNCLESNCQHPVIEGVEWLECDKCNTKVKMLIGEQY